MIKTGTIMFVVIMCIVLIGCKSEPDKPDKWEEELVSKVVDIRFVGVGGWGSPDAVRIWILENGLMISMPNWQGENVAIGDLVGRYRNAKGYVKWFVDNKTEKENDNQN